MTAALAAQTGRVYESMFDAAFVLGGYATRRQASIGERPDGGKHKVDYLLERDGLKTAVSLKWQQGKGSAEDNVPWEVICLVKAIRDGAVNKAYIVIGGNGWRPQARRFISGAA
jgi:hypothetical protein